MPLIYKDLVFYGNLGIYLVVCCVSIWDNGNPPDLAIVYLIGSMLFLISLKQIPVINNWFETPVFKKDRDDVDMSDSESE